MSKAEITPRGLPRLAAAAYLGVSASFFDKLVREGIAPKPVHLGTKKVWDRLALDGLFPSDAAENTDTGYWDRATGIIK